MSRAFTPPPDTSFRRGEVAAIVRWRRADSAEEYRAGLKRNEWEVVLPELVFG